MRDREGLSNFVASKCDILKVIFYYNWQHFGLWNRSKSYSVSSDQLYAVGASVVFFLTVNL